MIFDMNSENILFQGLLVDEQDSRDFGAALATILENGDILAFWGDLGVGKSTLSRAIVQTLVGQDEDVPSPTFTLVQHYDSPKGEIHHFDFYRLEKPEDALELDIEDAFYDGISLMEWPEKIGPYLPMECLNIRLGYDDESDYPDARTVEVTGPENWRKRIESVIQS